MADKHTWGEVTAEKGRLKLLSGLGITVKIYTKLTRSLSWTWEAQGTSKCIILNADPAVGGYVNKVKRALSQTFESIDTYV